MVVAATVVLTAVAILVGVVVSALQEIKATARQTRETLERVGPALEQALRDLLRQRQSRADASLACRLSVSLHEAAIPQRLAVAIYRIAQEALTNVMRHAGATEVKMALDADLQAQRLTLSVTDNGRGLCTGGDIAGGAQPAGIGLAGIRERVLANQGRLELGSGPDGGLALVAHFPLPPTGDAARPLPAFTG